MLSGRFFAAWGAYVGITFALGFVWHLKLFKPLYDRLAIYSRLDDPIIPLGLFSMLLQGAVLAYLFPLVAGSGGPIAEGLRFGLLMGAFLASAAVFAEAAKQRVTSLPTWLLVESVYYAIQFGLVGVAIALIHRR